MKNSHFTTRLTTSKPVQLPAMVTTRGRISIENIYLNVIFLLYNLQHEKKARYTFYQQALA